MKMIWASVHELLPQLREELSKRGDVIILADEMPRLYKWMCDSPENRNDVMILANNVITLLINQYKDGIVLVQPSGSLLFQYCLGVVLTKRSMRNQDVEDDVFVGVMYSYSKRISEDVPQEDGSVKKVSTFRHEKFI